MVTIDFEGMKTDPGKQTWRTASRCPGQGWGCPRRSTACLMQFPKRAANSIRWRFFLETGSLFECYKNWAIIVVLQVERDSSGFGIFSQSVGR